MRSSSDSPGRAHYAAIAERIEQTHEQIHKLLARASDSSPGLAETRLLLDGLPALLHKHFDDEEREDGLFEALRALQPSVGSDLKSLQEEHRQILRTVEELERQVEELDRLEEAAERGRQVKRIQQDTISLLRIIRRHERVETNITVTILYREDGGSG